MTQKYWHDADRQLHDEPEIEYDFGYVLIDTVCDGLTWIHAGHYFANGGDPAEVIETSSGVEPQAIRELLEKSLP